MAIYGLGAKSRRIYEFLRARIDRGDLLPGARLPSQRQLAATFDVSQMTARRALAELESDGFVVRQPGSGWYVRDTRDRRLPVTESDDPSNLVTLNNADESLRQREAHFRTLVEELPIAAYTGVPGSATPMTYASPQIESMLGYSRTQWTTDPGLYYAILHPEDRDG